MSGAASPIQAAATVQEQSEATAATEGDPGSVGNEGGASIGTGTVAVLVVGIGVLLALLIASVGRSFRVARSGGRSASPQDGDGDPWREAGRRHPVPPRDGGSSDLLQ